MDAQREAILAALKEIILEVQECGGHPPVPIEDNTTPISGLRGFDSLTGAEVTTIIGRRIGLPIEPTREDANLFVSKDGKRALTIAEIADRMKLILAN